jgi:hypothetical protein
LRADRRASARRLPGIHDDAAELAAWRFETNAGDLLTISTVCGLTSATQFRRVACLDSELTKAL